MIQNKEKSANIPIWELQNFLGVFKRLNYESTLKIVQFVLCIYLLLIISSANAISDGDKESECDEDGPSPEDSRKVNETCYFGTRWETDEEKSLKI